MTGWLESVVGPDYAAALMWTIVALIVLLVLLILIRIARGFGVGTFVAGGRNRKARLAVMDATAVDSHRRLVLVRRDDVEHLILIGGPTDVVVEQNIRLMTPARRLTGEDGHPHRIHPPEAVVEQPRVPPRTPPTPRPAQPPQPRPAPVAPLAPPSPAPFSPPSPSPAIRSAPPAPQVAPVAAPGARPVRPLDAPAPAPASSPPAYAIAANLRGNEAVPAHQRGSEIDEALLQELEVSLDSERTAPLASPPPVAAGSNVENTLDDEMSKLLNDLAGKR